MNGNVLVRAGSHSGGGLLLGSFLRLLLSSTALLLKPGRTALASSLGLVTAGLGLVSERLLTLLLGLGLVDELDQSTLVLEHVTLALQVEGMVQVLVNLLGFPVLVQEPAENTLTADPHNLQRSSEDPHMHLHHVPRRVR